MAAEIKSNVHSILHNLFETKQNYSPVTMALIADVYLKQASYDTNCYIVESPIPLLTSRFSQYLRQRKNTNLPTQEISSIPANKASLKFEKPKY